MLLQKCSEEAAGVGFCSLPAPCQQTKPRAVPVEGWRHQTPVLSLVHTPHCPAHLSACCLSSHVQTQWEAALHQVMVHVVKGRAHGDIELHPPLCEVGVEWRCCLMCCAGVRWSRRKRVTCDHCKKAMLPSKHQKERIQTKSALTLPAPQTIPHSLLRTHEQVHYCVRFPWPLTAQPTMKSLLLRATVSDVAKVRLVATKCDVC